MRRTLIYLSVLSLLLAAACSDDDVVNEDSGPGGDIKVAKDGSPDKPATKKDKGPDKPKPDAPKAASICGWFVSETGIKLMGVGVIACNDHECHAATSGQTGSFCLSLGQAYDYVFHATEVKINGVHYGDVNFPITITKADIAANKKIDVGKVILPTIKKTVKIDVKNGGTMDLGAGVTLKVPVGSTKLPPLTTEADVGGRKVDMSLLHKRMIGAQPKGKTAAAVYMIVPAEMTFKPPATLEVSGSGITAGTKLDFYHVSVKDGKQTKMGEAAVDSAGKLVTSAGKGITETGWYFFYKQ